MSERLIVTADPPTPNGDLHVGHLSGPYFAADVLSRALRLQGHRVAFYSNFDPHQSYVVTTARNLGKTPREVVDHFSERIAATLAADAIEPDYFGAPDERQQAFVCRFFEDLHRRGKLLLRDERQPYCAGCGLFLFETYIQGECPHCGSPCYGNSCEICALPNSPKDIRNPRCRHCGAPPSSIESYRGLFLPLSRYQEELERFLRTRRDIWRPHFFEAILPRFGRPLPDIPLSVVSDYGLPVSIPGFPGQVYNVRLEILPALIHSFDRWRERQPDGGWDWREAPGTKIVHFHGFENAFQYCVSFNTLLIASDLGWGLPHANLTNEFYLLDGQKFSTTRRHAIWGSDLLAEVPCDPVRFYLALTNPELRETNLVLEEFRTTTDRLLIQPWNEVHRRVGEILAGELPDAAPPLPEAYGRELDRMAGEMARAYAVESLSLESAARGLGEALSELATRARDLAQKSRGTVEFDRKLAMLLIGLGAFAVFAEPVMPRFAERLERSLAPAGRRPESAPWQRYRSPIAPRGIRWSEELRMTPLDPGTES